MRKIFYLLLVLFTVTIHTSSFAQVFCNGQICNADGSAVNITTLQSQVTALSSAKAKILYASNGSITVGSNSNARSSMLPPPQPGTSLLIPAGRLPVGSSLLLTGKGLIRARTTTPGSFSMFPNITPAGGTKTDLGGLSVTPLIGVAANCEIWLMIYQTPTGLLTSGVVKYGVDNGQAYSVYINIANVTVASDPSVDRVLGIDGQWAVADDNNYVIPNAVTISYMSSN